MKIGINSSPTKGIDASRIAAAARIPTGQQGEAANHNHSHLGYAGIAPADVRHLVRDHALQLLAIQLIDQAPRHANHRMLGIAAARERVGRRVLHHTDPRHRHSRRQRHLADHVHHRLLFH
jgi:hypothetical protein